MRIISSAPTRISLFGGGTDLPVYYENGNSGMVISMAINIKQRFELNSPSNEHSNFVTISENPAFYASILSGTGWRADEVDLSQKFDGEIESGLGTSAAAAVAMVAGLTRMKGQKLTRQQIAERAWDIEVNQMKLYGGKQDQYAAAFGGMNTIYFSSKGVTVDPWPRDRGEGLVDSILLFHTNTKRKDPKIQEQLLTLDDKQKEKMGAIWGMAMSAIGPIWLGHFHTIGSILNEAWKWKKALNPRVTTPEIDIIYDSAIKAGATGGKLCGSGGGGYIFFICEPNKQSAVTESLTKLGCKPVDFGIDWNGVETRFI